MSLKPIASAIVICLLAGCASVSMESKEKSDLAKKFAPPSSGNAGLYIYRSGVLGAALKKDIWVNGKCIGESASNVFFYEEVKGDAEYQISTESEFSPNDLTLKVMAGVNYFIRQFIKLGVFVGGAGLEVVSEEEGKKDVSELELATKGTCSEKSVPVSGDVARANRSLAWTANGMAPRGSHCHHPPRGATPGASAQLKRWAS